MKKFDSYYKYVLSEDFIAGGNAKGMSIKDIAKKYKVDIDTVKTALSKGEKVEMEHTNNSQLAREIALDHLAELGPQYYEELDKMEKKLKSKGKIEEDNMAGAGGVFGNAASMGHGGAVGNKDFYAPGDSRVAKPIGAKRKKRRKKDNEIETTDTGFPMQRRTPPARM